MNKYITRRGVGVVCLLLAVLSSIYFAALMVVYMADVYRLGMAR